jgi:hypothetical protein
VKLEQGHGTPYDHALERRRAQVLQTTPCPHELWGQLCGYRETSFSGYCLQCGAYRPDYDQEMRIR